MELDSRHLALLKRHAGIVEARRVTAYECVRRTPNGHDHRVRVEIQEARPGVTPRYFLVASADGKVEHDNGNDDLGQAICGIPWHKLEPHDEPDDSTGTCNSWPWSRSWQRARAARRRNSPWPGCSSRERTSCQSPAPSAVATCGKMWPRPRWSSMPRSLNELTRHLPKGRLFSQRAFPA
jgi:hypothetical protein